jgi:hypothetical protein
LFFENQRLLSRRIIHPVGSANPLPVRSDSPAPFLLCVIGGSVVNLRSLQSIPKYSGTNHQKSPVIPHIPPKNFMKRNGTGRTLHPRKSEKVEPEVALEVVALAKVA